MITIQAKLIKEYASSYYLDCEGDKVWFPRSQVEFNKEKEELTAPEWLLRQKFPNENF
ncbi:hypothetical protein [Christiangramia sp.]|uniref:hypothetical protein n=1 Tax=Christiangramia sp. TaxID=1931228 RepID=UPI00261CFC32|nr:hypothetical protein [Christiangramia sp.]